MGWVPTGNQKRASGSLRAPRQRVQNARCSYTSRLPMSEVFLARPAKSLRTQAGLDARTWQVGGIATLTIWLYWPTIANLTGQWWHDPNFSHGFFVPAFSLLLLWKKRLQLAAIAKRPSWAGLVVIAGALLMLAVGTLGTELFLSRSSIVFLLAGFLIFFQGWLRFRALLFPWLVLFLMIPIPTLILNQITFPLQLLASKLASFSLALLGIPVLREGNVIELPVISLSVAEACSGIRSLLSLTTLAIIYGYLMESRFGTRVFLVIASVPIAVAANGLRIVVTGLLVQYWAPDAAEGFFHSFSGWIIFVFSLLMLVTTHWLVKRLWLRRLA